MEYSFRLYDTVEWMISVDLMNTIVYLLEEKMPWSVRGKRDQESNCSSA